MSLSEVILFGGALNVAAGVGALVFGWVDDWIGSRPTAALVGVSVGPMQAASRLSGKATAFVGPLLVAAVTEANDRRPLDDAGGGHA